MIAESDLGRHYGLLSVIISRIFVRTSSPPFHLRQGTVEGGLEGANTYGSALQAQVEPAHRGASYAMQ